MKPLLALGALGLVLLATGPARAAQEWGLPGEKVARFEATVVDILCQLSGDCPAQCGAGTRQLGLLDDEGVLHLAIKNATPFSGAALELIDFCGKRVVADGLFTTNRGYRIFALQFVREAPAGKWRAANRFLGKWAKDNGLPPDSPKINQWFRNDPTIKKLIETDGIFGLGAEIDEAYRKSQQ